MEDKSTKTSTAGTAASEVVAKADYDALVQQAQSLLAEANNRITLLTEQNRVLQNALETQKKLVDKLLAADSK